MGKPAHRKGIISSGRDSDEVIRDCELAVRESGSGRPFVWGHGLLGSMAQEDATGLFDWSGTQGRLVRFDARGHGQSAASFDCADYRWPSLARDMLALAASLDPGPVVLGGVSMGCATSLHAATIEPARVAGLVLVAPPTAWATRPRQACFYNLTSSLVDWLGLVPFRLLASIPVPASDSPVAALQAAMVDELARADSRVVAATLRGAAQSDLPAPELLGSVRVPALILAWEGDPVHPVSTARRLAKLLPCAELHVAATLAQIRAWPALVERFVRSFSQ